MVLNLYLRGGKQRCMQFSPMTESILLIIGILLGKDLVRYSCELIGGISLLSHSLGLWVNIGSASFCSLGIPATLQFFSQVSGNPWSCLKCTLEWFSYRWTNLSQQKLTLGEIRHSFLWRSIIGKGGERALEHWALSWKCWLGGPWVG